METALSGGFADPARVSARAFRAALSALSCPGTIARLTGATPPEGLPVAAGVLALVLLDAETPVWLPQRLSGGPVADWLRFHANAPVTADRAGAAFGFGRWEELLPLTDWPIGTAAYPDRSATLVAELPGLAGGPMLDLSGPGIDGHRAAAPMLPEGAVPALVANAAQYPLGLDLFLVAGDAVMGLPRSTRIGG